MRLINKSLCKQLATGLVVLLGLSGCAETISEHQGAAITLVPVSQTLSLDVSVQERSGAEGDIRAFIDTHKATIATQGAALQWRTESGKQLADYALAYAKRQGVMGRHFTLAKAIDVGAEMSLQVIEYRVVTQVCSYPGIDNFGADETSCFVDNARWQSMVNPQNMLPTQYRADELSSGGK